MSRDEAAALPAMAQPGEEPVFAEPWQAQAFALAIQLHAEGVFTWHEWTERLSAELARAGGNDDGARYYEHWLMALEAIVSEKTSIQRATLEARKHAWAKAYRHTPHGRPIEL